MIVEYPVHFRRGAHGQKRLRKGPKPPPPVVEPGRVPRISRLMALAIRYDELIRMGAVKDYAELARVGGVTRARISQVMDLLNLAPDIIEALLVLPRVPGGRDELTERRLRRVISEPNWQKQREVWCKEFVKPQR